MKIKKPEIVAYMRPAFGEVVSQEEYARWEHEAIRNPDTTYGEWRKNETIEYSEPLIRLSDYEALQAECDALRGKTSMSIGVGDGTGNLFVHGDYDSIKRVQELLFECEKLRRDVLALVEALERLAPAGTDPDEEMAWFHEVAHKALTTYRKGSDE